MKFSSLFLLAFCTVFLAGCWESEQDCYRRLSDELERKADYAQAQSEDARKGADDQEAWYELYSSLLSQQVRLVDLNRSENANVCDFYIDINVLRRK